MAIHQKLRNRDRRQRITPLRTTNQWVTIFCVLQFLLIVPYASNFLPWAYAEGLFPLRPALYLIAVGFANFFWVAFKTPDWTKTSVLVLLLLALRALDAALLQRFTYPDGHSSAVLGLFAALFTAFIIFSTVGVMHKTTFLPAKIVAISTIILCVVSIVVEWMGLIRFTIVDGRYSGFAGDPNRACVVMNVMLAVFLTCSQKFWINVSMIALTAVGVLPTLSRGGLLALVFVVFCFGILNFRTHALKLVFIAACSVPAIVLAGSLLAAKGAKGGRVDSNVEDRIGALFGGEVSGLQSNDRMKDLQDGLEAVALHPVFGLGTGAGTNFLQPHNQVISLWIDLGLIGPALFLAILFSVALRTLTSKLKILCLTAPIILYFPLSQALVENYAYIYGLAIAITVASRQFFSVALPSFAPKSLLRSSYPLRNA